MTQNRWLVETGGTRGPEYAARFDALEASGADVHGEADFVDSLLEQGSRVVDGGCGTGRVGRELVRRGHSVVGVDVDESMLAVARERAPATRWVLADLLNMGAGDVGAPVDCVVLAGNVIVYLTPGTEQDVVTHVAGWLGPGGLLVAGFAADRHVSASDYLSWCAAAGLTEVGTYAGWDRSPRPADGPDEYLVAVHCRPHRRYDPAERL
ncbi:MAG TPA: class I SAM-dependent methyltransferase [Actinomycetales bacterium]|nr:class I SAM-dependent methyltransferase [Actinomycetales bacterium]